MPPKYPEVNPCPFCGGVARRVYSHVNSETIGCTQCKAQGPQIKIVGYGRDAQEKAREAWNSRIPVSDEAGSVSYTDVPPRICSCCKQIVKEGYFIRHEGLNLRTCPFCGSAARIVARETKSGQLVCCIECGSCNARAHQLKGVPEKGSAVIRKAAHAWNTRESDFEEDDRWPNPDPVARSRSPVRSAAVRNCCPPMRGG